MRQARGVLPRRRDSVIKDPTAAGVLLLATLRSDLDQASALAWLERVGALVATVQSGTDAYDRRTGTVAVGFGRSFFTRPDETERFPGLVRPAGFDRPPHVPGSEDAAADVIFYIMATQESVVADFLTGLWATRPEVATVRQERGHRRDDDTEPFGYKDGVRNVARHDRGDVVFVDLDELPEEPDWAESGTYLAWMKISQNIDAFAQLPVAEQDNVIGRDRAGRRLDLPEPARDEPPIEGTLPEPASHVRKAGPRGQVRDQTQIFRRGLPFAEAADGQVRVGLQFVSFQASLDQVRVVLSRWMLNPDFPTRGCGQDALLARGLVNIQSHGFFFVPPDTDEPVGAVMFGPAKRKRRPKAGRLAVRKRVFDSTGTELDVDLAGFTFQVTDPATGQLIGEPFTTNSHGHARSTDLPTGQPLQLNETVFPAGVTPTQPIPFTLNAARLVQRVDNSVSAGTVYGG